MTQIISDKAKKTEESADARRADGDSGEAAATARGLRRPGIMLILLAVAVVVVGAGAVTLWHRVGHYDAIKNARVDAMATAQGDVKDFMSYDYRTLDHDLAVARAEMTPPMAKSFDDYWRFIRPTIVKTQAQMLTRAQGGGVITASPSKVTVLIFVQIISVSGSHPNQPTVDAKPIKLTLNRVHGRWMLSGPPLVTPSHQ